MTNTRKLIFLLLLISLLGCNFSEESTTPTTIPDDPPENTPGNGDADTPSVTVSHITIATPQNSVALLQSFSLEVKKHFSDGTDKILTGAWLTANPDTNWYVEQSDTVTINTQGDVTGLKSGSSRVSVNIAGLQSNEIDIEVVDVRLSVAVKLMIQAQQMLRDIASKWFEALILTQVVNYLRALPVLKSCKSSVITKTTVQKTKTEVTVQS